MTELSALVGSDYYLLAQNLTTVILREVAESIFTGRDGSCDFAQDDRV